MKRDKQPEAMAAVIDRIGTSEPPTKAELMSMPEFDWRFDTENDEQRNALSESIEFCRSMDARDFRWLSLLGPSGRGKTHLARGVERMRYSLGKRGRVFYRWIDLLSDFRHERGEIYRFMRRCDMPRLLIIDDIGAGHETEFAAATLAEIAERRLGKPTVFTSNLLLPQIASIDSRIASRMIRGNNRVFTFTETKDYGLKCHH